ncbi:MAG TPA: PAS domain S-box protein, partial [Thermoleophilia bacterium]|nr:PAS domain S-box protein [Thermoleophilia bacterium]
GSSQAVAYAGANRIVRNHALVLLLLAPYLVLLTKLGSDMLIRRPVRGLVAAATAVRDGDLSVRTGLTGAGGEIGQLAQVFDSMAETIEHRTAAAEQSETRYRALVESTPNGIIVHQDGRIIFANEAAARIGGAPAPADLMGRSVMEFVHPDSLEIARHNIEEAYRTGEPSEMTEERFVRLDGTEIDVEVVAIPLIFEGRPAISTIVTDVTDRRQALDELLQLRKAVDASGEVIFLTDRDGLITFINPQFTQTYGFTAAEVVGKETARVLKSGAMKDEDYAYFWQTLLDKRIVKGELVNKTKDGRVLTVEGSANPIVNERDEVVGFLAIQRDITDLRLAEEALRESQERAHGAQRMEAVGQLAGGVAHDFNNLLTAIIGFAEIGQARSKGDPALDEAFREIRASADRAAALTRQLLAFSRKQPLQPRVVDLNVIAESISGLLRRLIREDVELALRCQSGLRPVAVDPGQIEQLITNLAVNARDAMPGGEKLTIETANVELGEDFTTTHPGAAPGPHVMLAVSDTGTGIDPKVLPHIFEPFFTTKEHGKGTGLGLSTVYGVVKQSGGSIYVYSEPDQGTIFKVYFPVVDRPVDWAPEGRPAQKDRTVGGHETILVVEDEPAVRALAVRVLEGAGYTVLHEGDPTEALKLYDAHGGTIHLLLTDVVLPGMSGKVLADTISAKQGVRPRVLFMSGYTHDAIVHGGRLDASVNFLEKPFTRLGLLDKVRGVLDQPIDGQISLLI